MEFKNKQMTLFGLLLTTLPLPSENFLKIFLSKFETLPEEREIL